MVITKRVNTPEEAAAAALAGAALSADNTEVTLTKLFAGHFFGESSLVNDAPRNANVIAVGTVRVECMAKEAFKPFLAAEPKFNAMITELLSQKQEKQRKREEARTSLAADGAGATAAAAVTGTAPVPTAAGGALVGGAAVEHTGDRIEVKITTLQRRGRTRGGRAVINGYVLSQKLGRGSYGTVWLARAEHEGGKYAMVRLACVCVRARNESAVGGSGSRPRESLAHPAPPHTCTRAQKIVSRALMRRKRFGSGTHSDDDILREVAVMKRLSHANVVKLHEVIDDP